MPTTSKSRRSQMSHRSGEASEVKSDGKSKHPKASKIENTNAESFKNLQIELQEKT